MVSGRGQIRVYICIRKHDPVSVDRNTDIPVGAGVKTDSGDA